MREFKIDFNKTLKPAVIIYTAFILVGVICALIFGVNLDINFSGGAKISYSYVGDITEKEIEDTAKTVLDKSFTVSKSTAIAGDSKTFEISLVGKDALTSEDQEALTKAFEEKFPDAKTELYDVNSVSPSVAGTFFAKCMLAVLITAVLVIVYVGFRFRRIGGVSAGITAFLALILDVLVTFFTCVIFGLQIDLNYVAVVLTILGYSLNDTIVIYDRVRENEKLEPHNEIGDTVNKSINQCLIRNIVTSLTTFLAVMTIVVVSEMFGLTSLRTFAIPMAFGLISGGISSVFVSGPVWVLWKRYRAKKAK